MSQQIACPHCGKQLTVPRELVGKKLACPRCSNRFRFSEADGQGLSSVVEVAPSDPNLYPPGAAPTGQSGAAVGEPGTNKPSPGAKPWKTKARKTPQTARFIERDANATNVTLGADGQLPELALASEESQPQSVTDSDSSYPWLMIVVLCLSVLLSVLILVIDNPSQFGTGYQAEDRHAKLVGILESCDGDEPAVRETRRLLGRALQAYNRGNSAEEKKYYRDILNVLNRENAPKYGGFTGRDKQIKTLVSELLR
ncbi:MAG: hypothetical protein ACODAD_01605 [Planctomycetota bacterium]